MDTPTCITHLRTIVARLETQREVAMLDRKLSRADQRAELNRLLNEQAAISYVIGLLDQRELMEVDERRRAADLRDG
jgi:hypothetical protein